uniref:Uncharacterized protein n=1 Tax=Cannabis sativa TaxID=3483 RepID=A0A803QQ50_CANSA
MRYLPSNWAYRVQSCVVDTLPEGRPISTAEGTPITKFANGTSLTVVEEENATEGDVEVLEVEDKGKVRPATPSEAEKESMKRAQEILKLPLDTHNISLLVTEANFIKYKLYPTDNGQGVNSNF